VSHAALGAATPVTATVSDAALAFAGGKNFKVSVEIRILKPFCHATRYISFMILHIKYPGRHQNDFNVYAYF
jgi:hypothetical protein